MSVQEKIEAAITWMEVTAKDNSHGYDQTYRWGQKGDYDCSAAVITAWDKAGVDLKNDGENKTGTWPKKGGANTTYDMKTVMLKKGFKDVTESINLNTGKGLKRGDVLLHTRHHVAMYAGNGKEVEASINEKGTATGGKPGDQTGREFLIRSYHNGGWDTVLRYVGDGDEKEETKTEVKKTETADTKLITNTVKTYKVIAQSGLNIRKTPSGTIITAVPLGTKLTGRTDPKPNDGWTAIKYGKIVGYVSKKWIEEV